MTYMFVGPWHGRYYASEDGGLKVTMLGNFGRVSKAHNHDGAADVVLSSSLVQRERNVSSPRLAGGGDATCCGGGGVRAWLGAFSLGSPCRALTNLRA